MANTYTISKVQLPNGDVCNIKDTNTTYTFANGTNGFTITPSDGTAQTVTVTPSITNNITGTGTNGYLAKFSGTNTLTNGPQLGSSTTTFLRNDGTWATALTSHQDISGKVNKSGDTMTNSLTITKASECGLEVNNTQSTNPNQVAFIVGTSGNGGIYSRKHSKWIVYADASGNIVLNGNANTATAFSDAKSIALTGDITGSASSTGGWSITTTIGTGKVTNSMLAGSIANGKLTNSKVTIAGNDISLGGSLAADTLRSSLGLSNAMHFIGTTTTVMSDGLTTANVTVNNATHTPTNGDVVLYSDTEYVWTGSAWERLGRDSSFKTTQTAITDSTGTSESTTATRFIYSISQDANGVVSVKTRPLPTYNNYSLPLAASGTRGGIQIGYSESGTNYAVKLSSEKAYVTVPWTDTKVTHNATNATKYYVTGTTNSSTNTSGDSFDPGIYSTTTAGELSSVRYSYNVSGTEKAYVTYNNTDQSLDFIFV